MITQKKNISAQKKKELHQHVHPVLLFSAVGLMFVSISLTSLPSFGGSGGGVFGGQITDKISCTCSMSTLIKVGSPKGGTFIKTATSKVYDHKALDINNYVLGNTKSSKATCNRLEYDPATRTVRCKRKGSGNVIDKIGTSK